MKSKYWILSRYVFQEVLFSFLIAFLFFFVIFFINQILLAARDHLSKGVGLLDVLQIVLYAIPTIIFLAAPFASMGAVVLALGRLSSDNEILAMQALGVSKHRIFIPILIIGLGLTVSSFLINDILMPLGGIQQRKLFIEIALNNIQVEFSPYSVKKIGNQTFVTGGVSGNTIYSPLLINRSSDQKIQLVEAQKGQIKKSSDKKTLVSLELDKVRLLTPDPKAYGSFETGMAEKMIFNVLIKDINSGLPAPNAADMSTLDVAIRIAEMERNQLVRENEKLQNLNRLRNELFLAYMESSENLKNGNIEQGILENQISPILDNLRIEESKVIRDYNLITFKIQFFQKFTIPLGCVELVLIGFTVGIFNRRKGRAFSIIIGLAISFAYWILLFVAQILTQQFIFPAEIAMFIPNFLLLVAGLVLYILRRNR